MMNTQALTKIRYDDIEPIQTDILDLLDPEKLNLE